jgi:hypothetical protein
MRRRGPLRAAVFYVRMVAAALLDVRSITGANPRRGGADATDAEPVENGVASA